MSQNENKDPRISLPKSTLDGLVGYIVTKPYAETAQLIELIKNTAQLVQDSSAGNSDASAPALAVAPNSDAQVASSAASQAAAS
jgi:hypothetical protein